MEIPKPDGGVRKLGIPTVTDRTIQQAMAQQLIPIYEPLFAEGSYGYRPGRSAKDAIRKVKEEVQIPRLCTGKERKRRTYPRLSEGMEEDENQAERDSIPARCTQSLQTGSTIPNGL